MIALGRRMFAAAFIAFGVLQFIYRDFVAGRPAGVARGVLGRMDLGVRDRRKFYRGRRCARRRSSRGKRSP